MSDEVLKYLYDINEAIEHIDIHLDRQRDYALFSGNITVRRAVERELEIIGEAVNVVLRLEPAIPISQARRIVDLRNHVIHAYDRVDLPIIWSIVTRSLPILQAEVRALLATGTQ
ncbi:HepT-like ribonuclease domain-containing protein [Tellurirhabdus rosea]|uniref:HepT-like ribonuclease domain-containing protein n=1 Tax=Tellurirhabdus rosea TaxID=2674997 RepID=UPI0022535919|nr:HepT-like ribonuclease domain-containing protein [Tellurirhabdus rosea]